MKLLILGGGGTLGAFSAGALEVVLEAAWRPDTWIGSSAGAINLLRCFAAGPSAPANFWRSISADPDSVVRYANSQVNEVDLQARHQHLANSLILA